MANPVYKRILLKLSGEALVGDAEFGISPSVLDRLTNEIKVLVEMGVEVGVVIGGGNFFRGITLAKAGISRITADQMGMLATIMNSLALRDSLDKADIPNRVMSAIPISGVADHYNRLKAIEHLRKGRVIVFAAGTGNPLVTTDSAASLRAIEVNADLLIKATSVDGIYTADPKKDPKATRYKTLTFKEALSKELGVMDLSAFCQCRDQNMPIVVLDINKANSLSRAVMGEDEGTFVKNGEHNA